MNSVQNAHEVDIDDSRQCSSCKSKTSPATLTPALLKSKSSLPWRLTHMLDGLLHGCGIRHVESERFRLTACTHQSVHDFVSEFHVSR